jgi:hypothetical protein
MNSLRAINFKHLSKKNLVKIGYGQCESWWIKHLHKHYVKTGNIKQALDSYTESGDPCGHSGGSMNYTVSSLKLLEKGDTTGPKFYFRV